ncbi:tetratricopeptide repeat protein [Agrobacterium sp. rho-13.3]|uniref:tetratricopeptide repeat protein n=1 Tax=Agrobacterium sp. rho-13.3 TaxID=3072980 RepID=UPI002A11EBCE|nr:tetratricopeptide repeat protein [Agrobacterium sp. rho-13.3]MDX8307965.1 tetratricopeptide repeat protein [Agrobacterium sp. rho-13.3]
MANENDTFIREVNEQIRSEQLSNFWGRYGIVVISAAVLIVVGAAGAGIYEYWNNSRASNSGDQFAIALKLASEGKNDEALKALADLETAGHGSYPVLAKFRSATLLVQKGDAAAAIAAFTAIGNDNSAPQVFRDTAKVRAAWLLVDTGTYEQVSAQAEVLTGEGQAMRNSAREALGLAAYKAGDFVKAKQWFEQITADVQAPRNVTSRAQIMLDNIAASGKAA